MFTGELSKVNPKTWKTFSKILVMEYTIEGIIEIQGGECSFIVDI